MVRRDDLPALELRVLETLTESRTTVSVVALAADLWQSDAPGWGADPVGLVQMLVESLGEMGLVNYRMHPAPQIPENQRLAGWLPYTGFATHIRLSKVGWELMGYPHRAYQVGSRMATAIHLDPTGDRTNFRKHGDRAEGVGDIETLPIPEHRAKYPHHSHNERGEQEKTDMPRQYLKVTDAIEGTVLGYRSLFPLATYDEIASETDIPVRTVKYVLVDLPRLRRMADGEEGPATQKQRILDCLAQLDFRDVPTLVRTLGRGDSAHDIVHALHDLKKQGLVTFSENANAKTPANIKLTVRGRRAIGAKITTDDEQVLVGVTHDEHLAQRAEEQGTLHSHVVIETPEPVEAHEPESDEFPILDSLLAREADRIEADNKGYRYLEAADLIRDNDPETAALLEQKAKDNDIPFPTPLESEYLRYAARQRAGGTD